MLALMGFPNQLRLRESVHMIVTEYGIANLKWRPLRERGPGHDRHCPSR